ncbi:MAG: bifunctional pyr operon transcriptional regulator/uracil phosphoribosyltransferase PyrR [Myxococcales bacterium]|nr:bifunctional pyr operon transcriptional regulator/uracil phosphoribosyltransferase PyrR [Myxococcales bacterium]
MALAIDRLAEGLLAGLRGGWPAGPTAIVGIRTGGVPLADRLRARAVAAGIPAPARGGLDITLYRDDLYTGLEKPLVGDTDLPFEVTGCGVVLVDDVLFTGRTIRAALGELHDFGRPSWVRLCVLVDRGHRELPIQPDLVGVVVRTQLKDRVTVDWQRDEVWLRPEPGASESGSSESGARRATGGPDDR